MQASIQVGELGLVFLEALVVGCLAIVGSSQVLLLDGEDVFGGEDTLGEDPKHSVFEQFAGTLEDGLGMVQLAVTAGAAVIIIGVGTFATGEAGEEAEAIGAVDEAGEQVGAGAAARVQTARLGVGAIEAGGGLIDTLDGIPGGAVNQGFGEIGDGIIAIDVEADIDGITEHVGVAGAVGVETRGALDGFDGCAGGAQLEGLADKRRSEGIGDPTGGDVGTAVAAGADYQRGGKITHGDGSGGAAVDPGEVVQAAGYIRAQIQ